MNAEIEAMREMRERVAWRKCNEKTDTFSAFRAVLFGDAAEALRARVEALPADHDAMVAARVVEAEKAARATEEAARRERLVKKFDAMASKARRLTAPVDRALLPNQDAYDVVMQWRPGEFADVPPGLMLCGETGSAKSRALWALVRVLMCEEAIECAWYCMDEFAPDAVDAAREGREGKFIRELATVPVLVLDDFGKERLTAASESALFAVIRRRCDAGLPILVSTQFSQKVLCERFRERETGEAVVRRLCEFCEAVFF